MCSERQTDTSSDSAEHGLSVPRLVGVRFTAMAVLLLAEIWLLRRQFTTDTLIDLPYWWAEWLRLSRFHTPLGLCFLGAVLLIGGKTYRLAVLSQVEASARHRGWTPALVHLVAFAGLFLLTGRVLQPHDAHGTVLAFWSAAWIVSGLASLFTLAWIALPARSIASFVHRNWWVHGSALVVAFVAFATITYLGETWPYWRAMSTGTLYVANAFLSPFADNIVLDPVRHRFGTESFPVHVTRYCSGYEGISVYLVFFTTFLVLYRERLRFPQALVLIPVGMAAVWIMNAARIAALILVGTNISPEVAIDGFHVNAGWPLICVVSFGFIAIGTRSRFFSTAPIASGTRETINPSAVYLAPMLLIVGTAMVAGAFTAEPDSLYPLRIIAAGFSLWLFRRELDVLRPCWSWHAFGIGVAVFLLWIGLHPYTGNVEEGVNPYEWQATHHLSFLVTWWIFKSLGTVVIAPVAEELAFRGFLMRRLVSANFERVPLDRLRWLPLVVTSLLFGALHADWVAGTLAGALFALALLRRGRLFDAVLAHGLTNLFLLIFAAITGKWAMLS